MTATKIWICLTESRDGDEVGASVHTSRDGAIAAAQASLHECLDEDQIGEALSDFALSLTASGGGAGDGDCRLWVSVRSSWLLA